MKLFSLFLDQRLLGAHEYSLKTPMYSIQYNINNTKSIVHVMSL